MDSNQVGFAKYKSKRRLQGEEAAGWRELLPVFFETGENEGLEYEHQNMPFLSTDLINK